MDDLSEERINAVLNRLEGRKLCETEEREAQGLRSIREVLRKRRGQLTANDVAELREEVYRAGLVLAAFEEPR